VFSAMDDHTRWVLPLALEDAAARHAEKVWLRFDDGQALTFAQAAREAQQVAEYLYRLGVRPGDHVALMLGNCADFVRAWSGIGRLGAVAVLLNTELKDAFLAHPLDNSQAKLLITGAELLPAVRDVAARLPDLQTILVCGDAVDPARSPQELPWSGWRESQRFEGALPDWRDIAAIMYTSGTSGPAKGVLMPHAHCTLYGIGMIEALRICADDVYYVTLPLFHANALLMQVGATLLAQASAFVRARFSASQWLDDLRSQNITLTNMLGATAAFVVAQPPTADDRAHRLRAMLNAPNLPAHETIFRQRFGVADVISGFGMTEVPNPVRGQAGRSAPGAAGWIDVRHFELIVADGETDMPVGEGVVGEILVRTRIPFTMMAGYHRMPEKTVSAWRNAWFHTGDAAVIRDGVLTYVDRMDDCIRRRGQNISPMEIEAAIHALPDVAEAAAYAIPSDIAGAEADIALAIVRAPGSSANAQEIGQQAQAALPRFARPRYLRLLDALPKTPTAKVQRAALRKQGVADAIDLESITP